MRTITTYTRHHTCPTPKTHDALTTPKDACTSLEVGLIGDEEKLGASLIPGVEISPLHAAIQGDGPAAHERHPVSPRTGTQLHTATRG